MPTNPTLQDTIEQLASTLRPASRRSKRMYEREFSRLLGLLSPRIGRLIRQYRLGDLQDDAQQAAAIGVHRALATFDPAKARFSTHVTWQIRGELQGLRHRMRLDQRRSAVAAGANTVSLEALRSTGDDARTFEIVDDSAMQRAEGGASDLMAWSLIKRLMDQLDSPPDERLIVRQHIFDCEPDARVTAGGTREQRRQIVRRTMRNCAKVLEVQTQGISTADRPSFAASSPVQ